MPDGASIDRSDRDHGRSDPAFFVGSFTARIFQGPLSKRQERERERERTFILEGNRAPVAKATHSRNREGPVRPRVRRQD